MTIASEHAAVSLGGGAGGALAGRLRDSLTLPRDAESGPAHGQALVVRAAHAADVASAVRFSREQGLPIVVRGGGHHGASTAGRGLVIDLARMKGIRVQPHELTARVEPGVTAGELAAALDPYGLATTTGLVSGGTLAGLALGGAGWLMGKYGLAIDNLVSVEIVTADGAVRHASADEHGDLFWAVRGGDRGVGIITSLEYRLHPVATVLAGMAVYPFERAREVLRFYREYSAAAPDELTTVAVISSAPDGRPTVAIALAYAGPLDKGERAVAPVRAFGEPLADTIRPARSVELATMLDGGAPGGPRTYEGVYGLPVLGDGAIEAIVAAGAARTSPLSQIVIQHIHGAAARIDPAATALALRREHYEVGFVPAASDGGDAQHAAWARAASARTRPFAYGGVSSFLEDEEQERLRAAYGANHRRLAAIKAGYDPENIF